MNDHPFETTDKVKFITFPIPLFEAKTIIAQKLRIVRSFTMIHTKAKNKEREIPMRVFSIIAAI